ncbi:MAG TPA: hypothetical protein VFP68_15355 [Burkholderiaceae bacterium]|nr:hypothetical protein [Burkholderiaceae bacterium]
MIRTSIRLSLLAAAACFTLGTAQAQTATPDRGTLPSATGTTARDAGEQDINARDQAPGSMHGTPQSSTSSSGDDTTTTHGKSKKKTGTKKSDKGVHAEDSTTGTAPQPIK